MINTVFSIQFSKIYTYPGPQMTTAVLYFFFQFLYDSLKGKTSLPFYIPSSLNLLLRFHLSSFYNLYFSCVLSGYFQSSWCSLPLSKHLYFTGIRRNPMHVILNCMHKDTKAKHRVSCCFLNTQMYSLRDMHLKSVSLSKPKSATVYIKRRHILYLVGFIWSVI